jgi:hypothetical protein
MKKLLFLTFFKPAASSKIKTRPIGKIFLASSESLPQALIVKRSFFSKSEIFFS